jgi:hypothetical protein
MRRKKVRDERDPHRRSRIAACVRRSPSAKRCARRPAEKAPGERGIEHIRRHVESARGGVFDRDRAAEQRFDSLISCFRLVPTPEPMLKTFGSPSNAAAFTSASAASST